MEVAKLLSPENAPTQSPSLMVSINYSKSTIVNHRTTELTAYPMLGTINWQCVFLGHRSYLVSKASEVFFLQSEQSFTIWNLVTLGTVQTSLSSWNQEINLHFQRMGSRILQLFLLTASTFTLQESRQWEFSIYSLYC